MKGKKDSTKYSENREKSKMILVIFYDHLEKIDFIVIKSGQIIYKVSN